MKKIFLLFNTLKYLKIKQFYYMFVRRILKPKTVVAASSTVELRDKVTVIKPIFVDGIYVSDTKFKFLNVVEELDEGGINWCPSRMQRLWQYNLHYFDYLREDARPINNKIYLLNNWIESNPQLSRPGWEPFTTSLRIVNWVFFLVDYPRSINVAFDKQVSSLYEQVLWLEKNDESHILANHYFENMKALLFAGVYFKGEDAERWLKKATNELKYQLVEQQLSDGGHYERSPQYHSLMLENYLDLYNLATDNNILFDERFLQLLKQTCDKSLDFLSDIVFPNNKIPLFNDSAFCVAPDIKELCKYANKLYGYKRHEAKKTDNNLLCKNDSGIYGFKTESDMLVIDCGDIGPTYQPGHTHCDFLSYELMLNNQMIIVDTGVHEYEPGMTRVHERSTQAHNTISVDDDEQSEIWGEFRVARRAKKLYTEINYLSPDKVKFKGAYNGFYQVKGRIEHHREILITSNESVSQIKEIQFKDYIVGVGFHNIKSYIHFHSDVSVKYASDNKFLLTYNSGVNQVDFIVHGDLKCTLEDSEYYPEFGLKLVNKVLVVMYDSPLPCELSYSIIKH